MANAEQLALLRSGVGAWNQWRSANPEAVVDLRGADLYRADLSRADLREADLSEANLSEADLTLSLIHI